MSIYEYNRELHMQVIAEEEREDQVMMGAAALAKFSAGRQLYGYIHGKCNI